MARSRFKRLLIGVLIALGVLTLIVATLPWWSPWLAKPLLDRYDVRFSSAQKSGYRHLVLRDVQFAQGKILFRAESVSLLFPLTWMVHRYLSPTAVDFVQVDRWELRLNQATAPAVQTNRPAPKAKSEFGSAAQTIELLQKKLNSFAPWLPRLTMHNGRVIVGGRDLPIQTLTWRNRALSVAGLAPPPVGEAHLMLSVPQQFPWQVIIQAKGADLTANLRQVDNGLELDGLARWQTNQLNWEARFGRASWIPESASAQCERFELPAPLVGLDGYQPLTGFLSGQWRAPEFTLALRAQAAPEPTATNRFPAEVTLRASGQTNWARIDELAIHTPWLQAELSKGTQVDFSGHLLSPEALVSVTADLSRQPWFPSTGNLEGRVLLRNTAERFPRADWDIAGTNVAVPKLRVDQVQGHGDFAWPWLRIVHAEVHLPGPISGALITSVDLQKRFLSNGVLHLEGRLASNAPIPRVTADKFLVHANFSGPIEGLRHDGALDASNLFVGRSAPLEIRGQWQGEGQSLSSVQVALSASQAHLRLGAQASMEKAGGRVQLTQLDVTDGANPLYSLAQPAHISWERMAARPDRKQPDWRITANSFRWRGADRKVDLDAIVTWPHAGLVSANLEHFSSSALAPFMAKPVLAVQVERGILSAHWTNGPLLGVLDLAVKYAPGQTNEIAGVVRAEAMSEGLSIAHFEVANQSKPLVTGTGSLPLLVDFLQTRPVQIQTNQSFHITAATEPNALFWNELAKRLHVDVREPKVRLDLQGSLLAPEGTLTAELAALAPRGVDSNLLSRLPPVENVRAEVTLNRKMVRLNRLDFRLAGQPVTASGQVPTGDDLSRDWRHFFGWNQATGRVTMASARLAFVAALAPEVLSPQGELALDLALRPEWQFEGEARLQGAATRPMASLGPIDDLQGHLTVKQRNVKFETLTGLIGGEPFSLAGSVDFGKRRPDTGMPEVSLRLRGQDVPLARQLDLILRSDLNLLVSNQTNQTMVVSGEVRLRDSVFLSDLSVLIPGRVAQPKKRPPYFSIDAQPLADWQLNVRVQGERFLKIRSPFFHGEVSSDLKLEGNLREPMAVGEVTVNSGVIQFPFATLSVNQGLISLSSAHPYQPRLYIAATGRSFGYDVRMELTGTADLPVLQFTSNPPLSSEQILLMLSAGEIPQSDSSMTARQKAGRLALFLGRNLLSELLPGAETAERLTVRSGEYLSDQGQQTYSLEYRLNKNWSLTGEYDRFGGLNAGFKWRVYSR